MSSGIGSHLAHCAQSAEKSQQQAGEESFLKSLPTTAAVARAAVRAVRSHSARARRIVSFITGVRGSGSYSAFEQGPNLTGRPGSSSFHSTLIASTVDPHDMRRWVGPIGSEPLPARRSPLGHHHKNSPNRGGSTTVKVTKDSRWTWPLRRGCARGACAAPTDPYRDFAADGGHRSARASAGGRGHRVAPAWVQCREETLMPMTGRHEG